MEKGVWIGSFFGNNLKSKTCPEPRRRIQNLKWGGIVAIGVAFAMGGAVVVAQQPKKVPRIGMLISGSVSTHGRLIDAFREGLHELGYVEGKNIVIEYRYGQGKLDRLSELAGQLVRLKPDVVVTAGTSAIRAAKQATSTIPIVVASGGDLLGDGLIASLSRPGGNITGSTAIAPDLAGKRLELLKEVVPKASRMAVLWHPGRDEEEAKEAEIAARSLGVKIQSVVVQAPNEFENAYNAMTNQQANAVFIILGSFTNFHRRQLIELALKHRLPAMCEQEIWADEGCLISYGPSWFSLYRRAATYVDKILKGAKPSDLPVEQPTKFEFVINLKTAKQIGLTIPQSVLYRADKVIK